MNKLLVEFKYILLFTVPFIILLLVYVVWDPFMIIFKYDDYNRNYYISKNVDFVTTEKYIANSQTINYDSFIFGSSISMFIKPDSWGRYIDTDNPIYSFHASGEHIKGVWSKIKYIHGKGNRIKNALIVVDAEGEMFGKFINDNPLFMKHYRIYPSSIFKFHYLYFLQFANLRYLRVLIQYKLTGKFYPFMGGYLKTDYYYREKITNEYHNVDIIEEFKKDSVGYYKKRLAKFIRSGQEKEGMPLINEEDIKMLNDIREIFRDDSTNYRIIIGPIYNQISFNKDDLLKLQTVFGANNVFDFSGKNRFSEDKSNFYDHVHFKKYVGDELLNIAYSDSVK